MDWLPIIGAIVGTGTFSAIVQGVINRRKTNADVSQAMSDAAASTVAGVTKDYDRVRGELDTERTARQALERKVDSMEREMREMRREREAEQASWAQHDLQQTAILQGHVAWDVLAVAEIQRAIDDGYSPLNALPPAPPLRAPSVLRAHVDVIHDVVSGGVD